ncbi:MAG: response regulator [Chloroflexi bacterium]|nr:response regulator [Chloroflexota bacterium]
MAVTQVMDHVIVGQTTPSSYHAAFSGMDDGVFTVSTSGQVDYCNARFEELVGIKSGKIEGQPYTRLFKKIASLSTDEARVESELTGALARLPDRTPINLQTRYPLELRLQIKLFPLQDTVAGEQVTLGWGGMILDMTANWTEINQWTDHLSIMTHSLRSSVATLKGFTSTLLSSHRYWEASERHGFIESIDENIDQLSRLLENAQELFKLEADAVELERRPTDIKRLLQRVMQSLALRKSGHYIAIETPEDLPSIEIDPLRIEQVMRNLLENAIKFTPRDKRIRITAEQQDHEVLITIADQGTGIPLEDLTRIFEGTYHFSVGGSELARGQGIGLHVARGLVLVHNGRIWAEENANNGTRVTFALPIEATTPARNGTQTPAARKMANLQTQAARNLETRPSREVAKVLVVDDDAQMLRLLKIKLEVEGFEVVTATRGNVALELAVVEQPDVILLDVKMPDSSGFDICARLREFTAVPIIMITGQSREEDMVRGLDAGADDYLVKPIRNKELLARVRANLRRARVPEQAPSKPIFRLSDLEIDFAQRQVTMRSQHIRLTPTEYKLLYHLAVNAGRILTHSQLLSKVWGPGYEEDTQYLWVNISRLRGKLETNPSAPEYILTEPGVGYYLPDGQKNS